ncbi:F-box only protein 27-like [Hippopotamus amphibius kiboko]|uniref:F-box only protein 27-like n=1 Tax=Hippopotamus amphibius kiboko TaxID=575201 RepID=UPI002597C233|nr:F-box only protein 27-like [Hippopotamus amphibius kiboko]
MVLVHVPPHTLLGHCRSVCRRWCDLVDCQHLWLSILDRDHASLSPILCTYLSPTDDPRPCVLAASVSADPQDANSSRNPRAKVSHVFSNLKKGVRFVSVEHWVWDMEFFSEHYGIYLPNSSAIVHILASELGEETMCTSASRNWPVGVPVLEPEPEGLLGQLPMELLEMVLVHVPPHMLLGHCRQVCRRWRDLVDGQHLWLSVLARDHAALSPILSTFLPPDDDPRPCFLSRFCERRPIGRNLLQKPKGEVLSSEDGWAEEEENLEVMPSAYMQTGFQSSCSEYHEKQVIDLEEEGFWPELLESGKLEICVSDWWGRRNDQQGTDCIYQLTVQLLDANQTILDHFSPLPFPIQKWRNSVSPRVSHVFSNLKKGVRFVSFEHCVWDLEFGSEQYAVSLTNSSVIVRVCLS